jgi:hypothetical protein
MTEKRYASFEEFWPYYVSEHVKKSTRRMHFAGTASVIALLGHAVYHRKLWPLVVAPVVGYGPAWFSHFFIEKNRPATFTYPKWSLIADFKMAAMMAAGEMDAEVERVMAAKAARESAATVPAQVAVQAHVN